MIRVGFGLDALFCGSLITTGFCLFYLFWLYRKEISALYLGGICSLAALFYIIPVLVKTAALNQGAAAAIEHGSLYVLALLFCLYISKIKEAAWPLASLLFLAAIAGNDVLLYLNVISTIRLLPSGLLIFVFVQAFMLFKRLTKTSIQASQSFAQLATYERFVPNEFLINLNKKNIVDVRLGDNTEKSMSILFSDMRNFTVFSESMTPEENFKFLNSYLTVMGPVIRKHNGFIDKYMGDAIMALFAASADDALSSAIEMLRKLVGYNEGRARAKYRPVSIGIGINTGSLRIGIIGEHDRMEATVISDAVNTASRIEGITKKYGVPLLISGATYSALQDASKYKMRRIGTVKVKGKEQWTPIWEVFDADPPDCSNYKLELASTFEEAVSMYESRAFEAAYDLFQNCYVRNPHDKPAKYFIDKCWLNMKRPESYEGVGIARRIIYERSDDDSDVE
ncbi:MAG: adenylate/guanylate cyclase domain-containing protein [Nitrospirae bacterium]|nr:adenylate/guanylate cyclase domain-containing protein [Nitrospirota bacterium]